MARRRAPLGPGISERSSVGLVWWRGVGVVERARRGLLRSCVGPGDPRLENGGSPGPWGEGLRAGPSAQRGGHVCTTAPGSGLAQAPPCAGVPRAPVKLCLRWVLRAPGVSRGCLGPLWLSRAGPREGGMGLAGGGAAQSWCSCCPPGLSGRPWGSARYAQGSAVRVLGSVAAPLALD